MPATAQRTSNVPTTTYETKYEPQPKYESETRYEHETRYEPETRYEYRPTVIREQVQPAPTHYETTRTSYIRPVQGSQFSAPGYRNTFGAPLAAGNGLQGLGRSSYGAPQDLQTSSYASPLGAQPMYGSQYGDQNMYRNSYAGPLGVQQPIYGSRYGDQYMYKNNYAGPLGAQQPIYGSPYGNQDMYRSSYASPMVGQGLCARHYEEQGPNGGEIAEQEVYGSQIESPWAGRTLLIRPVAAQLTHNTDFFLFKMDPFVEIAIGPHRYKTTVHKKGGKRPQWNETFSHELFGNEDDMTIIIWDQDRKKVDLVGETAINLSQVLAQGSSSNWYEVFWRGKTAGRILINLEIV